MVLNILASCDCPVTVDGNTYSVRHLVCSSPVMLMPVSVQEMSSTLEPDRCIAHRREVKQAEPAREPAALLEQDRDGSINNNQYSHLP